MSGTRKESYEEGDVRLSTLSKEGKEPKEADTEADVDAPATAAQPVVIDRVKFAPPAPVVDEIGKKMDTDPWTEYEEYIEEHTNNSFMTFFKIPRPRQEWVDNPALKDDPDATPKMISTLSLSHGHRAATPADLVLDLVFVVVLAKLGHTYHEMLEYEPGLALQDFVAIFIPVWFQWINITNYCNRWDGDDIYHKIYFMGNLILMSLLGLTTITCGGGEAHHGEHDRECSGLVWSFAGARLWTCLYTLIALFFNPKYKKSIGLPFVFDCAVSLIWLIDGNLPQQEECGVDIHDACWAPFLFFWWFAIAVDFLKYLSIPVVASSGWVTQAEQIPLNLALAGERQELFIIISLGEVIAASAGYARDYFTVRAFGLVGFVATYVVMIKVRYFDFAVHPEPSGHGDAMRKHALRTTPWRGMFFLLMHMPLNIAIVLLGAVMAIVMANVHLTHNSIIAASRSAGAIVFFCTVLDMLHSNGQTVLVRKPYRFLINMVFVVIYAILPYTGDYSDSPWTFLGLMTFIMFLNVVATMHIVQGRVMKSKRLNHEQELAALDEVRESRITASTIDSNGRRSSRTTFSNPLHRRSSAIGGKGGAQRQSSITGAELGKMLLMDPIRASVADEEESVEPLGMA